MANGVEEEELRFDNGTDEHHDAGTYDSQQSDNVHSADCVKNDVAWASQRFGGKWHVLSCEALSIP